jgi:hypothetical protein
MHEIRYKGAGIQVLPQQIDSSWIAAGRIRRHLGRTLVERPLALLDSRLFATESEACEYVFTIGKQQPDRSP